MTVEDGSSTAVIESHDSENRYSTTVVDVQLLAAGSANPWLALDAFAANATSQQLLTAAATRATLIATTVAAPRAASAESVFPPIRPLILFFGVAGLGAVGLQHRQISVRQHYERDVPLPTRKRTHFVMVKPQLAFCRLETFFN